MIPSKYYFNLGIWPGAERAEVFWYTDYKDVLIMYSCPESGNSRWSVFTSTPTPNRRYNLKIYRIMKRLGGNMADLKHTVCKFVE